MLGSRAIATLLYFCDPLRSSCWLMQHACQTRFLLSALSEESVRARFPQPAQQRDSLLSDTREHILMVLD